MTDLLDEVVVFGAAPTENTNAILEEVRSPAVDPRDLIVDRGEARSSTARTRQTAAKAASGLDAAMIQARQLTKR